MFQRVVMTLCAGNHLLTGKETKQTASSKLDVFSFLFSSAEFFLAHFLPFFSPYMRFPFFSQFFSLSMNLAPFARCRVRNQKLTPHFLKARGSKKRYTALPPKKMWIYRRANLQLAEWTYKIKSKLLFQNIIIQNSCLEYIKKQPLIVSRIQHLCLSTLSDFFSFLWEIRYYVKMRSI